MKHISRLALISSVLALVFAFFPTVSLVAADDDSFSDDRGRRINNNRDPEVDEEKDFSALVLRGDDNLDRLEAVAKLLSDGLLEKPSNPEALIKRALENQELLSKVGRVWDRLVELLEKKAKKCQELSSTVSDQKIIIDKLKEELQGVYAELREKC